MIPPPGDTDPPEVHERYALIASGGSKGIGGDVYYGYRDDLYEQVSASFSAFGVPVDSKKVSLHKGLFEDALNPTWPIAFAHVDCDWYEPVRLSLERIFPKMSVGAFLISDDYGGAAKAVDEFRDMHRDDLIVVSGRGSEHMILQRQ
jgi:asparagine synthase (glutamine-hydrolysing)